MPLNKGAKPGSKGFGENIATEIKAGKSKEQAAAIAYSVAKDASFEERLDSAVAYLDVSSDYVARLETRYAKLQEKIEELAHKGDRGAAYEKAVKERDEVGDKLEQAAGLQRRGEGVVHSPRKERKHDDQFGARLDAALAEMKADSDGKWTVECDGKKKDFRTRIDAVEYYEAQRSGAKKIIVTDPKGNVIYS